MNMHWLYSSLYYSFAIFWDTFWALALGYALSACVQVFVSREAMARAFGKAGLKEVTLATVLGAASSSCSFAAAAAGKSAFKKGAALVPTLAFMFASTNLVFELGAVIWVLLGPRFVLAEVVGAIVLIALMWSIVSWTLSSRLEEEARRHVETAEGESCHESESEGGEKRGFFQRLALRETWGNIADAFYMDVSMMWKELLMGFLIAGFAMVLIPGEWWQALFLKNGPEPLRVVENAVVGPVIAALTFLCSCANIPLAALLWDHGISFGGVISFIYADLIIVPLLLTYRKYYGAKAATYISVVLFASMVGAGLVVDLLFHGLGLVPEVSHGASGGGMHEMSFGGYNAWLNGVALLVLVALGWLRRSQRKEHTKTKSSCCCH